MVGGSNPGGGEIFRTRPDRSWDQLSQIYNGYGVFPGDKAAEAWRWPPTPSTTEVKERGELYLSSPLGLRDLFWGKLYLYFYCTLHNLQTQNEFYQILKKDLILRLVHDRKSIFTKICNFYLPHVRYDKNFRRRKLSMTTLRVFHWNTRFMSYSFLYKESPFLLCLNNSNVIPLLLRRARVSQSVQCLGYWLYVRRLIFWFPADTKLLSRLQILRTGCGGQPTTYSIRTGGHFPLGSSDQLVNLTTGIRVVLRVKMRGAAPSLPHVLEHFAQNNFTFTSFSETLPRDLTSRWISVEQSVLG